MTTFSMTLNNNFMNAQKKLGKDEGNIIYIYIHTTLTVLLIE